jgi:hypothetical protein
VLAQIARNEQPMERAPDMAIGRVWAYAAATAGPKFLAARRTCRVVALHAATTEPTEASSARPAE